MMKHEELIAAEIARQDSMWGDHNERADASEGQLRLAATAQLIALGDKLAGNADAFNEGSPALECYYPADWSGFRDYGSDVANMVVAIAYLTNEVKRLIRAGTDTTRTSRDPVTQPYDLGTQPYQESSQS